MSEPCHVWELEHGPHIPQPHHKMQGRMAQLGPWYCASKLQPALWMKRDAAISKSDLIYTCAGNYAVINESIEVTLKGSAKWKLFVDHRPFTQVTDARHWGKPFNMAAYNLTCEIHRPCASFLN